MRLFSRSFCKCSFYGKWPVTGRRFPVWLFNCRQPGTGHRQHVFECSEKFDKSFFWCDVGRKKPDHVVPRGADDKSFREKLRRDLLRGAIELDAPHHSHPANLDDSRYARFEFRELLTEPRAGFLVAREKCRAFDLIEHRIAEATCDRIS